MARITLQKIAHSYVGAGQIADYALKPLEMSWADGGTYALLGPSGCGKTTMLSIVSGLVIPTEGRVLFDERDVTRVPTAKRNIAQVFQFPVIYTSMTVRENLAFPLVCRRWRKERIDRKVSEIADLLDLSTKLDKRARSLAVDEKQLISLGRGLVREDVSAVLMDEPLSMIDPQLKFQLRRKLKEINERFNLTLVYVTHDQNEAMTFADRIMVMSEGNVVQTGTPEDLFEFPRTPYVGYFVGSPGMNFFDCRPSESGVEIAGIDLEIQKPADLPPHETLLIGIRPEYVRLSRGRQENAVPVRVSAVQDLGGVRVVDVAFKGVTAKVKLPRDVPAPADDAWMVLPKDKIRLYADGCLV